MKIILCRTNHHTDPILSAQGADDFFRSVIFAHISHLIKVTDVEISKFRHSSFFGSEQEIILSCSPQGVAQEDEALLKAVRQAIELRGNLRIIDIQLRNHNYIFSM